MTGQTALARAHTTIRNQQAALDRVRNLDDTPPQVDPDSETGRAYAAGWKAHAAAVGTAILDVTSHDGRACPQCHPNDEIRRVQPTGKAQR